MLNADGGLQKCSQHWLQLGMYLLCVIRVPFMCDPYTTSGLSLVMLSTMERASRLITTRPQVVISQMRGLHQGIEGLSYSVADARWVFAIFGVETTLKYYSIKALSILSCTGTWKNWQRPPLISYWIRCRKWLFERKSPLCCVPDSWQWIWSHLTGHIRRQPQWSGGYNWQSECGIRMLQVGFMVQAPFSMQNGLVTVRVEGDLNCWKNRIAGRLVFCVYPDEATKKLNLANLHAELLNQADAFWLFLTDHQILVFR